MADYPGAGFEAIMAAANKKRNAGAMVAKSLKSAPPIAKGDNPFAAAAGRRLKKKGKEGSAQEEKTEPKAEAESEGDF